MGGRIETVVEAYVSVMDVRVLGSLEVLREGALVPVGGPKQRTVLALLAASPGHVVSTDALIVGVYGLEAPPGALRTIHTYVSNLRHEVGDLIVRSGDGYKLVLDERSTVDSVQFEELYFRGSGLLPADPAGAGKALREALSLWRGHPFADVEAHGSLDPEITRLAELRVSALESRVEADLAQGGHRELVGELEALCEEYPLRESFRAQHMLALYRAGRQAEALRAYRRTHTLLAEELGIEPTPGLQRLEEMILTQDPELDLPPAVTIEQRAVLTAELADPWGVGTMRERDSALARRDSIISSHAAAAGGSMLDVRGSASLAAFPSVSVALDAARDLAVIGLQTAIDQGEVEVSGDRISGPPVNRSLRLAAIANPGQVLISSVAHAALTAAGVGGWSVVSLGTHQLRGLDRPDQLFQLIGDGLASEFGPLHLDRMPQPSPDDRPRGPLPGYELRDEIGANAYSVVTRAYQASVGREVAVRMFSPGLVSDPRFIRRFEAVAQRIAAVEHPHLVPLLDYWREPGRAILVNRLIDGRSLREAMSGQDTGVEDPAAVVDKIGSGLVVAHQYGLVHGQVGSNNVLLDKAGNPYLSDLGVSSIVHGLVGEVAGTPMTIDTDVFGLGTLIGEMTPPGDTRLRQVARKATDPDPDSRYGSMAELVEDLRTDARGVQHAAAAAVRNPYKGLVSYEVGDHADFYGRDGLIAELVETVASQTLTMVVGPSGIGKSSVVKAGLIPALRAGAAPGSAGWLFTDMYPGDHPFDGLEDALARVARDPPEMLVEAVRLGSISLPEAARRILADGRMVLVVDQFEELFTHVVDEVERLRFLSALSEVAADPASPVRVVATVRADFFDRPLQYGEFGGAISGGVVTVSAPSRPELAEIVVRPAEGVGLEFEPALLDTLINDTDSEIGGLPLLQHALTELFESRGSDRLTLDEYRSAGGLQATVGRRAEQVFRSLSGENQELARRIFLSLVSVDEDVNYVRRRVRATEFEGLGSRPAVQRVLEAFGTARLLVFDRDSVTRGPTVEVAHEALIVFWDRYRSWVDEVRDDLLARRRVEIATREWLASGEEAAYLMTAGRLERAENWRDRSGMRVGDEEARFLTESRRAVDGEHSRASRNRRRVLTGLSAALVAVLALGVFAWTQRNVAEQTTIETRIQQLVAQSELAMGEDPSLAINLALEAYEKAQALGGEIPGEVMTALQTTVQSSLLVAVLPDAGNGDSIPGPSWSPDMTAIAVGSSSNRREVVVFESDGFAEMARFDSGGPVFTVSFAPDGGTLAVSHMQTPNPEPEEPIPLVSLFEVGTWENVGEFVGPCCADWFEFSPDGRFLAASGWSSDHPGLTTVWSTDQPDRPRYVYDDAYFESWAHDSSEFLAVRNDPNEVHVAANTGKPAVVLEMSSPVSFPSFRPGGTDLVVTHHNEALTRVLSRSGDLVGEYPGPAIVGARFAPDGDRLIQWGSRDDVVVTSLGTGSTLQLHGHPGGGVFASPSPDGRFVAVATEGGETAIWDLTDTGPEELGNLSIGGVVWSAEPSLDESTWDAVRFDGETAHGVRVSSDGRTVGVGSTVFQAGFQVTPVGSPSGLIGGRRIDGRGWVEDIVTGEPVLEFPAAACRYPVALDDLGGLALVGGGEVCGYDAGGGGVVDLATGEYLFALPVLPIYGAFGHPGTPTEDLVVVNTGFDEMKMEVRRLPEGDLLASFDVPSPAFRPFISADGRWASWGTASSGGFLMDLQAVADGTSVGRALVFNPHVESGVTNFTRTGGDYLATSSSRGVIRVWRIDTQELWFSLPENEHPTFTWQFISDDGRYLYSADRTVIRRMPLDPEELAALARERAVRGFSSEECERFLSDETDCSVHEG